MEAKVNLFSAKNKFLQPGGSRRHVEQAIDLIQQKTYDREYRGMFIFSKIGIWFFPIAIVCLTTAGVGGLLTEYLPTFLAYPIAAIFAILIEIAQAAFGRPLMKRLAKKQSVSFGMFSRLIGFTLLSIGMGALAFYHVFLESEKSKIADNKAILIEKTDSLKKAYKAENTVLFSQLKDLNTYKTKRWAGMLTPEERQLQNSINARLQTNDSLQRAEIANLQRLYPIQEQVANWSFSPAILAKIIGSLLAVLALGFLTIYSHYADFCYARGIAEESSAVLEHDGEFGIYDEIATTSARDFYSEIYQLMPGFAAHALPELKTLSPSMPAHVAVASSETKQPITNAKIGFRIGDSVEETPDVDDGQRVSLDDNESRYNETRCDEPVLATGNRICAFCGNVFIYKHNRHYYCSSECRVKAWETKHNVPLKKVGNV